MWSHGPTLEPLTLAQGSDFAVGNSKIFIREPSVLFALENQRKAVVPCVATLITKTVRMFLAVRLLARRKEQVTTINARVRAFSGARAYKRDRARVLRIATNVRRFVGKCRVRALRRQFKNKPPRTYATKLQAKARGMAARAKLDPAVTEKAKGCYHRARLHKVARDIQLKYRSFRAKTRLHQHKAARLVENSYRTYLGRRTLVELREWEFNDVVGQLQAAQLVVMKHTPGFAPISKPHVHHKLMSISEDRTMLNWPSGSFSHSEKHVNMTTGLSISSGYHSANIFTVTGTEDHDDRYMTLNYDEGKHHAYLEFTSWWYRLRFCRTLHRLVTDLGLPPPKGLP